MILKAIQSTSQVATLDILGKAKAAILEGGFDDLALVAEKMTGLLCEQALVTKDATVSPLVQPLVAIANILAADRQYLHEAIAAYRESARHTSGRDEELNRQIMLSILDKAELLPTPNDRTEAYRAASEAAPESSTVASLAIHKAREQDDPSYFKLRAPTEKPTLQESVIESDLSVFAGDGVHMVLRHQAPSGVIYYSVVVSRGFSRENLTRAGVQSAQDLVRTKVDDAFDRILIPESRLAEQTRRDIDFMLRVRNCGIHVDAVHGRSRDDAGHVSGYRFTEGANPDRMRYMGIDAHSIIPQDGKLEVPLERIRFHADPALIGQWNWVPAEGGAMKCCVPAQDLAAVILALQTHGIEPEISDTDGGTKEYLTVARDAKGRLKNIIHQHILQERSRNLLNFAEALPGFANDIAVAAYKDACGFIFGLRNSR